MPFELGPRGHRQLFKNRDRTKNPKSPNLFDYMASLQIVTDSRERKPFAFGGFVVKGLATADYSVSGHEHEIAVERKSVADFLNCITRERPRFEREMERMPSIPYAAVVVEGTLADALRGCGGLHPNSLIGSIAAWTMRYRLPILFCGSREMAEAVTARLLAKAEKYAMEGRT